MKLQNQLNSLKTSKLMKYILQNCMVGIFIFSGVIVAETFEVGQEDKQFTVKSLDIKVGDTVKFVNHDSFFHNVFSLSDAKFFDLGSFPKNEFKEVVFDALGMIEVECAIHPEMQMKIEVK